MAELAALLPDIQRQAYYLVSQVDCAVLPLAVGSGPPASDRFTLELPYGPETLRWQVIYQQVGVQWVPDFIFSDVDFQPLDEAVNDVAPAFRASLSQFSVEEPNHLLHLVQLLIQSYSTYNRLKLLDTKGLDRQLQFELDTTASQHGVQVAYSKGRDGRPDTVWFRMPLHQVELDPLMPFLLNTCAPAHEGRKVSVEYLTERMALNAVFSLTPGGAVSNQLELRLDLPQQLISYIGDIGLPPWENAQCIIQYLPAVNSRLERVIQAEGAGLAQRSSFILALARGLGRPLEVDTVFAKSAAFILACEGSSFVLSFAIPHSFPRDQPRIVLQVHTPSPDLLIYSEYPWSPNWSPDQAAARVVAYVQQETLKWRSAA